MTTTLGAITPGEAVLKEEHYRNRATDKYEYYGRIEVDGNRVCVFDEDCGDNIPATYCDAHNTAQKTGKLPSQLLQERDELVGALEWLTQIGYGVGKRGGHPESGEIEQALTEAKDLLSKYPKP